MKLLEKAYQKNFLEMGLSRDLLDTKPKAKSTEAKLTSGMTCI